ncbi:hypothetical protein PENVUL_c026G00313 [Penicillium vulpinum]|uniref:Uncharacterized protein n=1 Tax=Penicillium vulpinum TaxID=29845 RepID=A0A1V6RTZ1_9EURO|nr:hypothetical protein PENVUL_c026G00313 [Penicillium vulpinum]
MEINKAAMLGVPEKLTCEYTTIARAVEAENGYL